MTEKMSTFSLSRNAVDPDIAFAHEFLIWHVWDGPKDGFAALVNHHKLNRKNLETLIYTYLGGWIRIQERRTRDGIGGANLHLAARR